MMNSKVAMGYIPKDICYVFSNEEKVSVGCEWDIDHFNDESNSIINVLPAFPVDAEDSAFKAKATSWAEGYGPVKSAVKYEIVENKPITGIKVCSIEHRSNGTVVYKAIVDKYYVDLREDVLMDSILKSGINPGGILLGEYVWVKMKSQVKLVRVNSELYKLILEFNSRKNIKTLSKKGLEVGGIYLSKKKDCGIFLGYVNSSYFEEKTKRLNYNDKVTFEYNTINLKKQMLFYLPHKDSLFKKEKTLLKDITASKHNAFKIKKTHSFIEKIGNISLPNTINNDVRQKALSYIKNMVLEHTGHVPVKYGRVADYTLDYYVQYLSPLLNMYEFDKSPVEIFDVKKYLLFS